jgi:hypothetical protein
MGEGQAHGIQRFIVAQLPARISETGGTIANPGSAEMDERSIDALAGDRLSSLLDVDTAALATQWTDADAAVALRHQLAAPLLPDLAQIPGIEPGLLESLSRRPTVPMAELLTSPQTSLELLCAIKEFGRQMRSEKDSPLRQGPGTVIYYAAIAAAQLLGQRITSLADPQLCEGFTWSRHQHGAESLHALFDNAIGGLAT